MTAKNKFYRFDGIWMALVLISNNYIEKKVVLIK